MRADCPAVRRGAIVPPRSRTHPAPHLRRGRSRRPAGESAWRVFARTRRDRSARSRRLCCPSANPSDGRLAARPASRYRRNFRDSSHIEHSDRPHLDRAVPGSRNSRSNRNRLVEILCFDQVVSAELLFGLGERPVSNRRLAVAHANGRGRRNPLERVAALVLAALRNVLREGHVTLENLGLFGGAHFLAVRLAVVDQKQVFHCNLLLLRDLLLAY